MVLRKNGGGRCRCSLESGVGAGRGEGSGESEHAGPLAFRVLYLIAKGRDIRGGLRGASQQNIHQLPGCALSGSRSLLIGRRRGRGSWVIAAGPGVGHGGLWFPCFPGPGAETPLRPGCHHWLH